MIGFFSSGCRAGGAAVVLALSALSFFSLPVSSAPRPSPQTAKSAPARPNSVLSGSDVMATVEGRPITRRELTYVWLSLDRQAGRSVGDLLVQRWRDVKGSLPAYSVSDAAIYARLYGNPGKDAPYLNVLSNMVTTRLVEIEAARRHIAITPQEVRAAAHEMLEQVRKQQQLTLSDDQILTQFGVPGDVFMADMAFRLRLERLLALDYAHRNGRALTAEERGNWKQIVEAHKAEYLTRLRHSAHISSVAPLPEQTAASAQQAATPAETPPPPPNLKQ
jgi:hypothetical protein